MRLAPALQGHPLLPARGPHLPPLIIAVRVAAVMTTKMPAWPREVPAPPTSPGRPSWGLLLLPSQGHGQSCPLQVCSLTLIAPLMPCPTSLSTGGAKPILAFFKQHGGSMLLT